MDDRQHTTSWRNKMTPTQTAELIEVELNNGKVAITNIRYSCLVRQYNWWYDREGYARTNVGVGKNRVKKAMHQIIFPAQSPLVTDHINGNKLDNRIENLRHCTRQENSWNNNKGYGYSKYKGVSFDKHSNSNPWRSRIKKDYKIIDLGRFNTENEAAIAYNEACIDLFGEFARPNTIISARPQSALDKILNTTKEN